MPLFKRGVERERFDCAISWLKKAIQQLLLTRGALPLLQPLSLVNAPCPLVLPPFP